MEITIVDILENMVCADTPIGCFEGNWCSSDPPKLKKYVVELDTEEVIAPDNIELSAYNEPSIKCADGIIYLTGLAEEIEDGVMYLRLKNTVMMLELCPSLNYADLINKYVRITLHGIDLYDEGIY